MFVNGVKPVTMAMIDQSQSWGFDRAKLRELRYNRAIRLVEDALAPITPWNLWKTGPDPRPV
jgi:hypothetical protein